MNTNVLKARTLDRNTGGMRNFDGIPIMIPNTVYNDCFSHYISYNNTDWNIYGSDTTAIVLKCWFWSVAHRKEVYYGDVFLILNGKHDALLDMDGIGCLEYFSKNIHLKAKHSDDVVDYLNYKPMFAYSNRA